MPAASNAIAKDLGPDQPVLLGEENRLLLDVVRRFDANVVDHDLPMPVVLQGESGSGKSLVIDCLVNSWKAANPSVNFRKAVVCATASDLSRTFAESIRTGDSDRIHRNLVCCDLLAVEDIQRLSGKNTALQWFGRILDERSRRGRCSLVTCGGLLIRQQKLTDRLKSRLTSGLVVSIHLPESETRGWLIDRFVAEQQSSISKATRSSLIAATSGATYGEIKEVVRQRLLSQLAKPVDPQIPLINHEDELSRRIIRETAQVFGVRVTDMRSKSRRRSVVVPRAVAMFLIREFTDFSLLEIGRHFQNRDHSTVSHACQKIGSSLPVNPTLREQVDALCARLDLRPKTSWF